MTHPLFVLYVLFLCHFEISQTMMPLITLLTLLESPLLVGVCGDVFVMFLPPLQELLNIEKLSQRVFFYKKVIIKPFTIIGAST